MLEIASGSGQHAAYFAARFAHLTFLPSDVVAEHLESIRAHVEEAGLPNLEPPRAIDARDPDWRVGVVDAVFCANLVHIAPWDVALALFEGAARHLRDGGVLVTYGPYRIGDAPTAPSNAAFDADLRARDPRWGVRDLEALIEEGMRVGLVHEERLAMPANNFTLVFRKVPRDVAIR